MGALTIADLTPMAGEPMVADTRLGKALGFAQATHVRRVIRSNQTELLTYGGLYKSVLTSGSRGGRPTEGYWLNEQQAALVCMFSKTEKAAAVRKQVIQVFLAWRRGELTEYREAPDATVQILAQLERRLGAMEAVGQRLRALLLDPLESALALTHVVDLWFHSSRQRRPRFWSDVEVRGLILSAHRQMTLDECRARIVEMFGEARAPSRSAIHRFWKQLDRLRGQYPSLQAH